jgi:hypothetical protein
MFVADSRSNFGRTSLTYAAANGLKQVDVVEGGCRGVEEASQSSDSGPSDSYFGFLVSPPCWDMRVILAPLVLFLRETGPRIRAKLWNAATFSSITATACN